MSGKYHLAIDLGTYNSAAAVLEPSGGIVSISASAGDWDGGNSDADPRFLGGPAGIWTRDGVHDRETCGDGDRAGEDVKPFPSVVAYHPDGTVRAVGQEARVLAETEPQWAVWGVKRLLGKTYREALAHGELGRMLIPVEPDEQTGRCMFMFDGKDIRPEDVCAEILRHIRRTAEQHVGAEMPNVIISVPAYFDAIAISATVEAAKRAGFKGIDTIPEPVAAALALDLHVTPRPLNFLVFDIGAGTLDVTAAEVCRTRPGPAGLECRCRKNTGDTHLGGLDMDDRLVEWLTDRMKLPALREEERLILRRAAETARIALTTCPKANVEVRVRGEDRSYRFDQLELEEALRSEPRDLLEACEEQVHAALTGAAWKPEEVERLLLVGGPAAMPCVLQTLRRVFHRNPEVLQQLQVFEGGVHGGAPVGSVDRMLAVSLGAAKSKGARMVKVHPYGYGFVDNRIEPAPADAMVRVYREPRILVRRDSVFPSDAVIFVPETAYYRLDHIFSVEILQHVPDAEQSVPGMGKRAYRFLEEFQVAFRRVPFLMQISMRLNENGEVETTIRNLLSPESATYVGLGSSRRIPIELPTSKLEAVGQYRKRKKVLDLDGAERLQNWGAGFARFLDAKCREALQVDPHVAEGLDKLGTIVRRSGARVESETAELYTVSQTLLHRALEVKLVSEEAYYRFRDELDSAWGQCWRCDDK